MLIIWYIWLVMTTTTVAVPHYYIIVRLSDPGPLPVSAQFKLLQPANSTRVWDCVSGLTPITYRASQDQVVKAQSIDMKVGSVVECLGLNVRVVESEHVPRWEGEDTSCPGLLTSTTQLERSDAESRTTEYFQLTPPTLFRVFISRPSDACVTSHVQTLPAPSLAFNLQGQQPHSCEVISANLSLVSCNLTILTPDRDVVATAVGTVNVRVPSYVWKVPVSSLECRCSCLIRGSDTGALRTRSIFHNTTLPPGPAPPGLLETFTIPDTALACKTHIIVIGVVSALLLITVIAAVFLWNLSRDLRRKLGRITGRRCRVTGMKNKNPPDFHPPDMDYERIHQCHHYNTLSLRLGDSKELVKRPDTFPVYQKLPCDETCESL